MAIRNGTSVLYKNILFAFFDGEAFDYIGSSAAAYSMAVTKDFPVPARGNINPAKLRMEHISHFIELNQIAPRSPPAMFGHVDPVSANGQTVKPLLTALIDQLKDAAKPVNLLFGTAPEMQGLPPASVQSFLKHDYDIASLVLTNHEREFNNKYYNSFLDSDENLGSGIADQIAKVSQVVSKAVFDIYTGTEDQNLVVDLELIKDLLECFTYNRTCSLFQKVGTKNMPASTQNSTFSLYVSVAGNSMRQLYVSYVQHLLVYLTGEDVSDATTADECFAKRDSDLSNEYYWMSGDNGTGICKQAPTFATSAISPAFDPNNPDWASTNYSTWTESVWSHPRVRIFLKPSATREWVTLAVGFVMMIVSFVVVYFVEKNSSSIFVDLRGNVSGAGLLAPSTC
jgi:nicastrin